MGVGAATELRLNPAASYQRGRFGPIMSRKASNVPRATWVKVGLRLRALRTKCTQFDPVR